MNDRLSSESGAACSQSLFVYVYETFLQPTFFLPTTSTTQQSLSTYTYQISRVPIRSTKVSRWLIDDLSRSKLVHHKLLVAF